MTGYGGADRSFFWQNIPPISEREINTDFQGGVLPNKAYLNIVPEKDTLDAHVLSGMPYGRNSTEANKPTLEFPMYSLREAKLREKTFEKEYEETKKNLLKYLPEDLKQRLKSLNASSHKDPLILGLEKALFYLSQMIFWLSTISLKKHHRPYISIVDIALQNMLQQGKRMIKAGFTYLETVGQNNPQHDRLFHFLKQLAYTLSNLSEKKSSQSITSYFNSFSYEYELKNDLIDLQIIGAMIKNIDLINKSQKVDFYQQRLLYGFILSSCGHNSSTSLLDEQSKLFCENLVEITECSLLKELTEGEKELLRSFYKITLIFSTTFSSNIIKSKFIPHDKENIDLLSGKISSSILTELETVNFCCLECLIKVFLEFELLEPFFENDNINKKTFSQAWEAFVIVVLLKFTSIRYPDSSQRLLFNLREELLERIYALESFFLQEKIEKKFKKAAAILGVCHQSLKKKDMSEYFHSSSKFLELLGIGDNQVWEKLYFLADTIESILNTDLQEYNNNFTDVVQI